jgi:hypothetical protein
MRTCSQKNIEANSRHTEAGCHSECEPTYIDAQRPLVFNLKTAKTKLDRSTEFLQAKTADVQGKRLPIEIPAKLLTHVHEMVGW